MLEGDCPQLAPLPAPFSSCSGKHQAGPKPSTPGPSSAPHGRLLIIYLFIYLFRRSHTRMMTGKLRYLSPSGEQFRLLLPSKIIRAFFFWWEKWGDLQWKWRKKPSLPWDALDAAFLLLLLVLLQRHLSSLNPLSEPVSIPRTWAEMLILLTKVNLYVQSGTSRVVSVMLLFVWFLIFL